MGPPPSCSVAACPPRRLTSRCSTSRTRTPATSLSGSPTTSSLPSPTSPLRASRWLPPSSATPPPSRSCSSVCLQRAVFAVLQEQEYQQHELQRNPRNDDTLRRVYEQYTIPNAIYATKLGREDSEEAFKIYAEDKQQQQEQRQEEQQQHQQQQLWHQRPQQPQLWRQQEPQTQRNYQQGSKKKDVPPTMPRRYGTDSPMIPVEQPKQQQQQPQPPRHWNFNFQYQEEPPPPFFRCNSSSSSLFSSFGSSSKDNSSSHNHHMIVE